MRRYWVFAIIAGLTGVTLAALWLASHDGALSRTRSHSIERPADGNNDLAFHRRRTFETKQRRLGEERYEALA
jgi:hypothetical protein